MCKRRLGPRKKFDAERETFNSARDGFYTNLDVHTFNHQAPSICRTCYAYVTCMLHSCCAHVALMLQPRAKTRLIAVDWCDSDHYHDRVAVRETCPTCAGCGKVPETAAEAAAPAADAPPPWRSGWGADKRCRSVADAPWRTKTLQCLYELLLLVQGARFVRGAMLQMHVAPDLDVSVWGGHCQNVLAIDDIRAARSS